MMNIYSCEKIKENTVQILQEIKDKNIKLLIATKTHFDEKILQSAIVNKTIIIGENRVQEALKKKEILEKFPNEKHFIGRLQKNKIRKVVQFFDVIETVDSLSLLNNIERISREENKYIKIFFNINISNDERKSGFSKQEMTDIIENYNFSEYKNIEICGFFTILQWGLLDDEKRKYYREMNDFFNESKKKFKKKNINSFAELSMGMSQDYNIAMEEGATIIRVGTKIFGKREEK